MVGPQAFQASCSCVPATAAAEMLAIAAWMRPLFALFRPGLRLLAQIVEVVEQLGPLPLVHGGFLQ